jgi:hypothetical protein
MAFRLFLRMADLALATLEVGDNVLSWVKRQRKARRLAKESRPK